MGVVKNFYFKSLHNLIEPLVMVYNTRGATTTTVKISPRNLPIVKEAFKKNFPASPFAYSFFDETISNQYQKDRMTMSLFNVFTVMAVFVSCLGLYGLVAWITIQRKKEISIRKVLGASLQQLLALMTTDFIKLIFWSLVISLPVAGIAFNKWLVTYAYHIQISWWIHLIPVLLILFIALGVISKEIIRTALANPIKSLKTE